MREHALWQRNARRHQECWPVDRVETRNILADNMRVCWPVSPLVARRIWIAECGNVVGQSIDPDIHDVLFITWNRNAPIECRARNRQILQARLYEANDLVATLRRHDEAGIVFIKLKQLVLIIRQTEEIAFFLNPLDRRTLWTVANIVATDFSSSSP